jgi:hypothetical protein
MKPDERCELDSSGSGYRLVMGFCEHGNEPSGSVKGGEVIFLRRTLFHGVKWLISSLELL